MTISVLAVHVCQEQSDYLKSQAEPNIRMPSKLFSIQTTSSQSNIHSISSDSHCLMKNILPRLFANIGEQIQKEHLSSCKEYNSGSQLIARCQGCGDKYHTFETKKQTKHNKNNLSKILEACRYPLCLKANIHLDLGSNLQTF